MTKYSVGVWLLSKKNGMHARHCRQNTMNAFSSQEFMRNKESGKKIIGDYVSQTIIHVQILEKYWTQMNTLPKYHYTDYKSLWALLIFSKIFLDTLKTIFSKNFSRSFPCSNDSLWLMGPWGLFNKHRLVKITLNLGHEHVIKLA